MPLFNYLYLFKENVEIDLDVQEFEELSDVEEVRKNKSSSKIKPVTGQKKKKRVNYIKWSECEINAVKRSLGKFIALRKIPQQHDCLHALQKEPILKNRSWKNLKFQVANIIKKMK